MMKTLKDHTLIYDDECPMCKIYTGAFIRSGMLDADGRKPFSALSQASDLDHKRACNEIALVNRKNNSVIYGIDSLFTVIEHSFPMLSILFDQKLFRAICQKIYCFVSYNRKVIAPGTAENRCIPDFNFKYRWVYIAFAWFITSLVLSFYSELLVPLIAKSELNREFIICAGQIAFQAMALRTLGVLSAKEYINYFGHMMTVSLLGALLLTPAFLLNHLTDEPYVFAGYFSIVVTYMLIEHVRRIKLLGLPHLLTATWILYRLLVLGIMLKTGSI